MSQKIHLDLNNARHAEQKAVMEQYLQEGISPFLPDRINRDGNQPILKQGKYWYIVANRWPYANTKHHYLIITNEYLTRLDQLTPAAGAELIELVQWLAHELNVQGGALALRFGDTNYSGGTVDHLHWQFIVPNLDAPDYERVRLSIGKKSEKLQKAQ